MGIKWFGEIEYWLSFIKIITLTGLILLGLIIDLGGVPGQERIGFRYWTQGRAFKAYKLKGDAGKFLGFVNALVLALFAYMGTELVGVTVGEARVRLQSWSKDKTNPRTPARLSRPLSERLSTVSSSSTSSGFSSSA